MSIGLFTRVQQVLSRTVEAVAPVPGAAAASRAGRSLARKRMAVTFGYFHAREGNADGIVAACRDLAAVMSGQPAGACLAIKAPPLDFDRDRLRRIAEPASEAGMTLVLDSLTPAQAAATVDLAEWMAGEFPSVGLALPARWSRSVGDAARFRDMPVRIRLIRGEWADPSGDPADVAGAYLDLARSLAGRAAPVGVATHDPALAQAAIDILRDAGTPCELEQLRGLPGHRTRRIAAAREVPVRIYWPFGPGWWPYAAEKLMERPYLPWWWLRDRLG